VIKQKLQDYQQLMKLNLSMLVVFSSIVGYLMVPEVKIEISKLIFLFLGGMLVTAAANATNELLEKETDAIMKRTLTRPLPDKRMSNLEAIIFTGIVLFVGLYILYHVFNPLSALIALISYLLYSFLYTPLKKITAVSVLIGAIPGSLPCLIGWVAATNHMGSLAAWTLFILQFFWQFPHFWSIAWLGHEDYEKAGMKMLPTSAGKVGQYTAFQCVLYSAVLIPLSALPMIAMPETYSWISFGGLVIAASWMLYNSILFLKDNSDLKARKVMFSSFVYLPMTLISLIIDKFI
jgi:protoheme IX farnesyltransferase